MGKFSKVKKYNLDSLSIDEKIKFLDKEMEKTGLNEVAANSTSGVYQQARTDENDKYANFIACSHNGKGFGISSPNGSAGGAVIEIDDPTLPGVAKSPPHPVTGQRVTAQTHAGFGSFEPTRPGYRRSPSHRMHGSVIWYWNPSGGGGSGSYNSLEYTSPDPHGGNVYTGIEGALYQAGYGYWGSNFIGMPMLRSDGLDANLTDCIRSFDETSGQPDLPVLFPKDLDDPEFMPPKIPGMSDEAFRALLRRLGYDPDSPDPDDPDKTEIKKGEKDEGEEEEEDGPLVHGMTQEEVKRKYGNYDDDQLGRLHIKRLPDGSYREMTQAEINAFNKYYGNKVLGDLAEKVGISYSLVKRVFDTINPLGKKIDDILKGDSGYDKLDKLLDPVAAAFGKGIASRAFKGKFKTPANVMFRYDKWLAGGAKGRVDVTNEISTSDMKKLSSKLHNYLGQSPDWWVNHYQNLPKTNANYAATREDALKNLSNDIQRNMDSIMKEGGSGLSMTFHNNVQLDRAKFISSGGKTIELTKTYKFSERTGSVKGFSNKVLGRLLMGMGVELDRFGTGGLHNTIITLLGSKYGLRTVNRQYGGKADSAPGMPMKIRIPSNVTESVGSFDAYMNSTNLLTEDVKLGHFDPEALTVDIEDIRKGILPEFPKDPPPEMIDGYSKKSKLAPKQLPKDPFIKITKKDLAKNHKLKDSEIKEFMRQIDAVNEYIQKHPEELIYVQQRYPVNDKRLAALNFKMDQMLEAGKEYLDTQFPENQRLVDRLKKATKKTMELTNPEAYKGLKKPDMELMSLDNYMKEKRVVSRHFKKKRQSKSMFRVDMDKVKEKNRKVAEQKVAEWQEKRRIELLNSNEFEDKKYDWRKEIGENFVNSTQGMKVGQTFTHVPSGETVTTSGVLGGIETLQTNVSILGDEIPGPNATQYGLQGFAKPIDIMRRGKKKTEDLNKELDSSEKYTKEIKADEYMKARVDYEAEQEKKAAKIIYNAIKLLPRTRFNQELKVLYGYLSGEMTEKITNKFISKKHLISLFKTAGMRGDGRVQMDDFIVGSGQKLIYDPNTDTYSMKFNYDFETNAQELLNTKLPLMKRLLLPIIGGKYGYDAGIFGRMVERAKELGFGQNIEGEFTISGEDLNKINPKLIELYNTHPAYTNDMGGFDTGHGYSSPPAWLDKWARRVEFTGDLRSLWDGKTRTWNLRGKIVDNYGRSIKKPITPKPSKSKSAEKIKSMAKTKRQSLSLDEPFVRTKGKKKEEG